jgi:hypothetical protein
MEDLLFVFYHAMTVIFFIAVFASGFIAVRIKSFPDWFIFIGFLIAAVTFSLNIYYGYTAEYSPDGKLLVENQAILSPSSSLIVNIIAYSLISLGLVIKAYKLKK